VPLNTEMTTVKDLWLRSDQPPEAHQACVVFACQTDGLLAILVFQYSPYEAGAGKIFWVKDRNGIELPVITARYSIWEHANNRERAGTPAKIAREIRQTVEKTPREQLPRDDWVRSHMPGPFSSGRPAPTKMPRTCRKQMRRPKAVSAAIPQSLGALNVCLPVSASSAPRN
jgi:hypothetical protein